MELVSALARRQVGAIDAHLARLAHEIGAAHNAHDYATQLHLLERIDVLLDRRLRATEQSARLPAA